MQSNPQKSPHAAGWCGGWCWLELVGYACIFHDLVRSVSRCAVRGHSNRPRRAYPNLMRGAVLTAKRVPVFSKFGDYKLVITIHAASISPGQVVTGLAFGGCLSNSRIIMSMQSLISLWAS